MINLSEISSILQIGFSGFAFLLAALSYKLLKDETNREGNGRKTILNSISKYTVYTLLMAILVIVARVGEKGLDYYFEYQKITQKQKQTSTSANAQSCTWALNRLLSAETKINNDYNSLLRAIQEGSTNCETTLKTLTTPYE